MIAHMVEEIPDGFCADTNYDHVAWTKAACAKVGQKVAAEALVVHALAGLVTEHRFLKNAAVPVSLLPAYLAETSDDLHLTPEEYVAAIKAGRQVRDMDKARWFMDIAQVTPQQATTLTRDLVYLPRAWHAIEVLAKALLEQITLAGQDAAKVIDAAWAAKKSCFNTPRC